MNLFSDFIHGLLGCGGPETDVELDGNHYAETAKQPPVRGFSGDVTIPSGSALTIKEGATVNDEAGALAGGMGGGSGIFVIRDREAEGETVQETNMTYEEFCSLVDSGSFAGATYFDCECLVANLVRFEDQRSRDIPCFFFVFCYSDSTSTVGFWFLSDGSIVDYEPNGK